MRHYKPEQWIDLVRNQCTKSTSREMRSHAASCRSCAKSLQRWQRLAMVMAADARLEVPAAVVAQAEALFVPRQKKVSILTEIATLVFDSEASPAPIGVRGAGDSRRMVYQADAGQIELLIDSVSGGRSVAIAGYATAKQPGLDFSRARARVTSGAVVLAETETSENGEFHFEVTGKDNLTLHVATRDGLVGIVVPTVGLGPGNGPRKGRKPLRRNK